MQVTRYSDDVIQAHIYMPALCINAYGFNLNLHPVCAVNVLLNNEQRGMCIKGVFWPPLEPKTEIY